MHARTLISHLANPASKRSAHGLSMQVACIVLAVLAGCSRPQNFSGSGDKPAADAAR